MGDARYDTNTANLERGVLFPYNRSVGIYHCPASKTTVVGHPTLPRTRTYQLDTLLNQWLNGGVPPWYPDPWEKRKFSDLATPPPTGVLTFIDAHPNGQTAAFVISMAWPGANTPDGDAWGDLPGEQHNRGANLAFADGPVEHFPLPARSSQGEDDELEAALSPNHMGRRILTNRLLFRHSTEPRRPWRSLLFPHFSISDYRVNTPG